MRPLLLLLVLTPSFAPTARGGDDLIVVPVHFHVVAGVTDSGPSEAQIRKQIEVLNDAFTHTHAGSGPLFRFRLESVERITNQFWFNLPLYAKEFIPFKHAHNRGGGAGLDVYLVRGDGAACGLAYYPEDVREGRAVPGILLDWRTMPGGVGLGSCDAGDTLAHEVGHAFGLEHAPELGLTNFMHPTLRDSQADHFTPEQYRRMVRIYREFYLTPQP